MKTWFKGISITSLLFLDYNLLWFPHCPSWSVIISHGILTGLYSYGTGFEWNVDINAIYLTDETNGRQTDIFKLKTQTLLPGFPGLQNMQLYIRGWIRYNNEVPSQRPKSRTILYRQAYKQFQTTEWRSYLVINFSFLSDKTDVLLNMMDLMTFL